MQKTLFITVYDGDTEKVILRSQILVLLKAAGHRVVLCVRGASRLQYYKDAFEKDNVTVELLPPAQTKLELIWHHLSWNTVPTHSVYLRRNITFQKKKQYVRFFFEYLAWLLGHVRLWREFLRFVYLHSPDTYAGQLFDTYKPDLVFSPNMFSPEDCRMLRAAKKRGIPTVATAKSWDVLTTKAFSRVRADRLLVFNEFNKEEAVRLADYKPQNVVITGFPQFDAYAHEELFESREAFMERMGGDTNKRMILIAVPGDWKTPHTKEIMVELQKRIDAGHFKKPLQVLARFHPKYPDSSEGLKLKDFIFDRPGTHFTNKRETSIDMGVKDSYAWTFTDKDIAHLASSIRHSDIIINTESTLTLDAAANDRPTILIGYDGDATLPYWDQVARIYERDHYKHVTETKAAPLVKSHDELEREINRFLEDPEYLRQERELLKRNLMFKVDGQSSKRVADAVLALI